MLKPVRFVFFVIIMVIPGILCFLSFLTISYRFPWCFPMFPLVFLQFPQVFLLFPLSVSPVSYFRFCVCSLHLTNKRKNMPLQVSDLKLYWCWAIYVRRILQLTLSTRKKMYCFLHTVTFFIYSKCIVT